MVAVPKKWPAAATADLIAVAVVAAARVYGDDPVAALDKATVEWRRRCLAPAIRGVVAVTGAPKGRLSLKLNMGGTPGSLVRARDQRAQDAEGAALAAVRAHVGAVTLRPTGSAMGRIAAPLPPTSAIGREKSGFGQLDQMRRFIEPANDKARTQVSANDRELIDAALRAGKVTVLPGGHAAGLSKIEGDLWAAPPPRPDGEGWGGRASAARGGARGGAAHQLAVKAPA